MITSEKTQRHRAIWQKKRILQLVYTRWYQKILEDLSRFDTPTLEIGAGIGNFKSFHRRIIASDIQFCSWLNLCQDAHRLPFKKNTISNIVMIDVLHHLSDPLMFFQEASRILRKHGKIILIEPYPSLLSLFVYRKFHPEPFLMDKDYFLASDDGGKNPWESNQAIAYLLFFKFRKKFLSRFGDDFKLVKVNRMCSILYPASGGFEGRSFIPDFLIPLFMAAEAIFAPLRYFTAFRAYIAIRKK
ncbi:MAG: methyltransferase domain-containing protein [Chitinivibrionales bacterium]|nr:methyltransferase domain-containing protein [Chitinivibrionales bacterium]